MLDLRRLMLLCDLSDLGTVAKVAERRAITSSAVSQQLRVLEAEADAVLFRRDGRTLALTRSGAVLVEHSRRVLGAVDEAMTAVAATRESASGQLIVGAFNMAISILAAPMVQRLATESPDVSVHVQQHVSAESLRLLRQGELDLAIVCEYEFAPRQAMGGLHGVMLVDEPLVVVAPPELHARAQRAGLGALSDWSWVTGPRGTGLSDVLEFVAERAGFVPLVSHRLVGAQNICELAATGAGPAVVPRLSIPAQLEPFVVDGCDAGHRRLSVVTRSGRDLSPNVATALSVLREFSDRIDRELSGRAANIA